MELWLVFRRVFGIVVLFLNDNATGDDDETEENANSHGDYEIEIVAFMMF